MLPIRLLLKNFLPYRAPDELKFDGIHLACLTGANGAGKSSILDAITWVLWGSARAKRDEDLIHQGQDDMYVQLDFEQEGNIYRVIRRRSRSKRGSSTGSLDLFVLRQDGQPVMMSEPNMRATQEKIIRLLRLDYETFVHSAFLQQGKADAFTTQAPAKRKQILADILGLELWATYEEQVKDKLKQIDKDLAYHETRIKEINTELARKPALEAEQAIALKLHADARAALINAQNLLFAIKDAPALLKAAQEKRSVSERRKHEYQGELETVKAQIVRQERQIAEYAEIIAMRDEIEQGYAALQTARDTDQSLNAKLTDMMNLDKRRASLANDLNIARTKLESEAEALQKSIGELEQIIANQPADDLEAVQAEVSGMRALELQREDLLKEENLLREERAALKTEMVNVEALGKDIRERLATLQATNSPTCPLCGQALTTEHRQALTVQLMDEIQRYRETWAKRSERSKDIDKALKGLRTQVVEIETTVKQLPTLIERVGKLQMQKDTAAQAAIRLKEDTLRLQAVINELGAEVFAPEVRQALAQLEQEFTALDYDQATHDSTRRMLDEFKRYEQLQMRLGMALESLPMLEEGLNGNRLRQANLMQTIDEMQAEIDTVEIEIAGLQVQADEYNQREQEVRLHHTQERNAYERLVNVQQALSSLEVQATRKIELEKRQAEFCYQQGVYKELKDAFGRNGIPAMIIETAIPELEVTANDLLSRMTDGRMSLRLTTQKEKVTGGVSETLDIDISDELGTRNYEMYSGGEAFRINFALRIALSQMLARRAGAQLRTLFIDEGFGTQDDVGRSKLVEAINAIQDEFDLILVITHIDELRDNFPVHIMIDKTTSGSRISVR